MRREMNVSPQIPSSLGSLESSQRRQSLFEAFKGQWVAVSDDWAEVFAHGLSYLEVCESARRAGAVDPLLTRLV
jgi:hypothetical protein